MPLPSVPLPRNSIEIGDQSVDIRSLTRSEAMRMQTFRGREDDAEIFLLMCGTGCTEAEAKAFRDDNDMDTAGLLIDGIIELSNLTRKENAPDPKADTSAP